MSRHEFAAARRVEGRKAAGKMPALRRVGHGWGAWTVYDGAWRLAEISHEERWRQMADAAATPERLPVFVYGSLRVGEGNYHRLVAGNTTGEVPAILHGHRMYRNWIYDDYYPCVVDGAAGESVLGDLLYLRDDTYDHVLATLDQLEMYDPATHDGPYLRVRRIAFAADDAERARPIEAWVYHASPETLATRAADDRIPGGDWLAYRRAAEAQR